MPCHRASYANRLVGLELGLAEGSMVFPQPCERLGRDDILHFHMLHWHCIDMLHFHTWTSMVQPRSWQHDFGDMMLLWGEQNERRPRQKQWGIECGIRPCHSWCKRLSPFFISYCSSQGQMVFQMKIPAETLSWTCRCIKFVKWIDALLYKVAYSVHLTQLII